MSYALTARAALFTLAAALPLTTPAQAAANTHCAESSMTLPPGALYPNGIARAADGTLYVGLITSGNVLRKRPGKAWETFSLALTRCSPQTRCGWTNGAGCCGAIRRTSFPAAKRAPTASMR
ncbi:hypothetical protein [Serratia bockelmannii]|uniref:hypothetical protein n=1 Tax=Serratia bockelmannii TaxID=2703793 RepID=UPI003F6C5B0C